MLIIINKCKKRKLENDFSFLFLLIIIIKGLKNFCIYVINILLISKTKEKIYNEKNKS